MKIFNEYFSNIVSNLNIQRPRNSTRHHNPVLDATTKTSSVWSWNCNTSRNNMKKSLVICMTQLAGGLLLKMLNYFEVMLNVFQFSRVWENIEFWLVCANKLFLIVQPYFSTDIIKRSKCQLVSFFLFLRLLMKKTKFFIKFYCFNRYNLPILWRK